MKRMLIAMVVLLLGTSPAFAQQATVKAKAGTDSAPPILATVRLKQRDVQGNAPPGLARAALLQLTHGPDSALHLQRTVNAKRKRTPSP